MDQYVKRVQEAIYEAEALDSEGAAAHGITGAQVDVAAASTNLAGPNHYAFAWKILMNSPPVLIATGDVETDTALKLIYAIATVFHQCRSDYHDSNNKLEKLGEGLKELIEKSKEAKKRADEARHEVEIQARYQKDIQDRLEGVRIEHRASPEILKKEENEWQHAVLIAGGQLYEKGQIYSKAFEQQKKRERVQQKKIEAITKARQQGAKKWLLLDQYALPNAQYLIPKIEAVLTAMKLEKGEDERLVRLSEAHFNLPMFLESLNQRHIL